MDTGERIVSLNPAKPAEVVGTVAAGGAAQIDEAFAAAWRAFPGWAARPAAERAAVTVKLASELRRRKLALAAWETLEASKNWLEAEADVAEAIDFCEYYARQALELARPVPTKSLARGNQPVVAATAGSRGGHQSLEFPAGDPGGHDHGPGGGRQHCGAEALLQYPHDCRGVYGGGGRSRPAGRRHQFPAGHRRRHG